MSRVIPLNTTYSDGSVTTHPTPTATLVVIDNEPWERLVGQFLTKEGGDPGWKDCVLSALPAGYQLYYSKRATTTSAAGDPYLYGHPTGGRYRSANKFGPHVEWLTRASPNTGGRPTGPPCVCVLCEKPGKKGKKGARLGSVVAAPAGGPASASAGGAASASGSAPVPGPASRGDPMDGVETEGSDDPMEE